MKKSVIFTALGVMGLLLLAAVVWDSLRYASKARERFSIANAEMQKQEERLVKLLDGSPQVTPEAKGAIAVYQDAESPPLHREAYDKLVAAFRQTMSSEIDPTNPLDRKFMDEIAGAINRREVAQKQYDVEWTAYQNAMSGFRGRVARVISAQARADFESAPQRNSRAIQVEKEN